MAIKETPVSYKTYYKSMKEYAAIALEGLENEHKKLNVKLCKLHDSLLEKKELFEINFKIKLDNYNEFIINQYTSGTFLTTSKNAYMNKNNDYEIVADLYDLYTCAILQKEVYEIRKQITLYKQICNMSLSEYHYIIKTFYTEVQKKLVLEGKGYVFEDKLGWICINRYKIRTRRKKINFAATKKREAEIIAQGKRVYNKQQAEWCAKNGIEYEAEDKRVFLNDEYQYEIPLIKCELPDGGKYKLERADYRGSDIRGKTNQDLLEECNYDKNKIMNLNLDMKAKLLLCVEADKMLYMNFIRTPEQTPLEFKIKNNKLE